MINVVAAVIDKENRLLARESFNVNFAVNTKQHRTEIIEKIQQIIPIRSGYGGLDYRIFIGFELTPNELIFNREEQLRGTLKRLP